MLFASIVILCSIVLFSVNSSKQNSIKKLSYSGGRKRKCDEDNWKENIRKKLRNEGKEYTSTSGKKVSEKKFVAVRQCCSDKCFEKASDSDQKIVFDKLWTSAAKYNHQNYLLNSYIQMKISAGTLTQWRYFFRIGVVNVSVCRKFLCNLLQIKRGRFVTVQNKIIRNQPLKNFRSSHDNRPTKLTAGMKKLIQEHCETLDHTESHHTYSSMKYFEDPELTLGKLYELFCEYYNKFAQKTIGTLVNVSTYIKYFSRNVKFGFSLPRTDVCNDCYESEISKTASSEIEEHKLSVQKHKELKKFMLAEEGVLCLEFDFGQNLPVPKIPVSEQFYKRLLWLHVFNVNVLSAENRSYMYFFMESIFKKGANTVCNFLLHAIQQELSLDLYNKIYLFSDSCGGQNKNYLVMNFLALLAKTFQIEIHHVYPVKGHSYCSCDRNFGLYGNKKGSMERIETAEAYYKLVKEARDPPLIIIRDSDIKVADFESIIESKGKISKNLHIGYSVKIVYFPNGSVEMFDNYDGKASGNVVIEHEISLIDLQNSKLAPPIGITEDEKNDVTDLLRYLSDESRKTLSNFMNKSLIKESRVKKNETQKKVEKSVKKNLTKKPKAEKNVVKNVPKISSKKCAVKKPNNKCTKPNDECTKKTETPLNS